MNIEEIKEYHADRLVDGEDGGYPLNIHVWLPNIDWLISEHDRLTTELASVRAVLAEVAEQRDRLAGELAGMRVQLQTARAEGMETIQNNKDGTLTVNILRHWGREKIVNFAEHLLGSGHVHQASWAKGKEDGRHEGRMEALNAVFQINGPSRAIVRLKEKYSKEALAIPAPTVDESLPVAAIPSPAEVGGPAEVYTDDEWERAGYVEKQPISDGQERV